MVEQTTRTLFPNYFNGSEIVIAGKLADRKVGQLHVEVTASNSKKFVILKTDVPVEPQRAGHGETGSARPQAGAEPRNHVERLWSYLTVKELLSSWRHSRDEQDRERLRQKAQALALAYRFLTPLTAMHLRSAGQPEKLEEAQGVSAAVGPETVMQSLRGASPQPGEQVRGAPALPPPPAAVPYCGRPCRALASEGVLRRRVYAVAKAGSVEKFGNVAFVSEMLPGKVSLAINHRYRVPTPQGAMLEAPG